MWGTADVVRTDRYAVIVFIVNHCEAALDSSALRSTNASVASVAKEIQAVLQLISLLCIGNPNALKKHNAKEL